MRPLYLETPRLLLRELTPDLNNWVFSTCSDDAIKTFFGHASDEELALDKQRFKLGWTTFNRSFLYFHLIDKTTQQVIGWCGFHTWYTQHARAELGYVLGNVAFRGQGLMKEALPPIIRYGFEHMQLNRIEAFVGLENGPSQHLIRSNGFVQEGLLREHYRSVERIEDSLVFSLLKKDYF